MGDFLKCATGGLTPDLTILLDINPAVGLERRNQAGNLNRLDALDLDFHQRVREGYLQLAEKEPERWVVVDAEGSFWDVQSQIRSLVLERLRAERGEARDPESG